MYVYFLVSTIALTTVLFPNKKYVAIVLGFLAVICGARDGVLGYDFLVYENYFDNLISDGNIHNYEIGYYWLNYLFKINDFSFNNFLFVVSFFYHSCLFIVLFYLKKEIGINPGWVLFIYVTSGFYFWHSYTLLRQSFAISVFYLSIGMSLSRAIAFNFVGPLFHISSTTNILIFAFLKIKKTITLKSTTIIFILLSFLSVLLVNYFKDKFDIYEFSVSAGPLNIIETLLEGLLLFSLMRENKFSSLIRVIIVVSILFSLFGFFVNEIFIRFLEPYRIFMLMAYALVLMRVREFSVNIYYGFSTLFILFSYLRMYRFFDTFGDHAVPYVSIF